MSEISGDEANAGESEDRLLERNLASARLLIAYLAHNHREAPAELVSRVIEACRTPRDDWDAAREAQFWLDLNTLSTLVQPATIETIEVNSEIADSVGAGVPEKRARCQWIARRYSLIGLATIITVLLFQIYWIVGSNILKRAVEATTTQQTLQKKKNTLINRIKTLDARIARQTTLAPNGAKDADVILLSSEFDTLTEVERPNLDNEIDNAEISVRALYESLKWSTLGIPRMLLRGEGDQIYVESQRILNAAVVEYVLPLLLGLLGAIVFVLREISREIRAKIFLPNHTESYRIRLYLGMIAGLTFAWLFSWIIPAGSESGLGAASPLAIAFIVGYSVEILFSALDRIIGSMTKKKETEKTDPTVTSV